MSEANGVMFELECEPTVAGIVDTLARLASEGCKVKTVLLDRAQWAGISARLISEKFPVGSPGAVSWDSVNGGLFMSGPTGDRVELKERKP